MWIYIAHNILKNL